MAFHRLQKCSTLSNEDPARSGDLE